MRVARVCLSSGVPRLVDEPRGRRGGFQAAGGGDLEAWGDPVVVLLVEECEASGSAGKVTAVFTSASFAPAQSIDQGWRLSGAANPDQSKHAERVTHDSYIQRVLVRRERTRTLVYIKRGLGGFSSSNSKRKRNAPDGKRFLPLSATISAREDGTGRSPCS